MSKIINVTRSSMPPIEEYIEEISSLWDTRWLTNSGAKHIELEEKLKDFLKVDDISLVVNGHNALELALEAMELKGEVITTPFTFVSTTNAIIRKGLTPVFCDIREDDFTLDASKIESLITDKTCAILPVHVYGNVCDHAAIKKIADKHGLKVIYDAAHAFGVEVDGQGIGSLGDASMFSFHATKVYHSVEGGAVTFSGKEFYEKLKRIKNFGISGQEDTEFAGGNSKMNEFCAAMGLCNLRHVNESIAKRKKIVTIYRDYLSKVQGIQLSAVKENIKYNYAYFPIVINENEFGCSRDELFRKLAEDGIMTRKYFYPLTSEMTGVKKVVTPQETPIAKKIADRVLTIPLYEDLELEDAKMICEKIVACSKH